MTIIVEDGTAKTDAQVYCSVAFADAWHLARGITLWATLLEAEKEQALVRAAGHMTQVYRLRWHGYRKTNAQALEWPRYECPIVDSPVAYGWGSAYYEDNVVPIQVQQANAELALKAAAGDLDPDIQRRTRREKVDVIEVEYEPGASPVVRYRSVDNLLGPLLKDEGGASFIQVGRA